MAIPLEQGSWTFQDLLGARTRAGWTRADPRGGPCSSAEWQEAKKKNTNSFLPLEEVKVWDWDWEVGLERR